eukprot:TRINITY_DN11203_c0_g1_i1.p1 TRINITY_DN11203_c0_g1~~TRINITY_DN11203_c0_g1_i1.p1  ORF type:complete len:489 (-),score=92.09 TRINITY_DN11203_c0_g1_i1:79-1545(-)
MESSDQSTNALLSSLQKVKLKNQTSKPEDLCTTSVDESLKAVINSLYSSPQHHLLPLVKFRQGASTIEVLERILSSLKEMEFTEVPVVTIQNKSVGKVVDHKPNPSTQNEDDAPGGWVSSSYWKDFLETVEDVTPGGAKISIAIPKQWNRKVLLQAHGFRPEGTGLIANLNVDELLISELLKEGWIVGMSSYRRDGRIIQDALTDMNELRQYIIDKFGKPKLVLLEGRSMGGAIVTYLAEFFPHLYDGAVAIGAALSVGREVDDEMIKNLGPNLFSEKPGYPILYLTNQSELTLIQKYIKGVQTKIDENPDDNIYLPALWEVWREGHNHVSQLERISAVKSVENWINHKTFITARKKNIFMDAFTTNNKPSPKVEKNVIKTQVVHIDPVFRSVYVSLDGDTLDSVGIKQGKFYQVTTPSNTTLEVYFGTFPFLCPKGTWISYLHPDGFLVICIFGYYDTHNPAEMLSVQTGDTISLTPLPSKIKKQTV